MNEGRSDEEALWTAERAARHLGVKVATLYTYVSRGWIRSAPGPNGRSRMYERESVERFQERRTRHRGAPQAERLGHAHVGDHAVETEITVLTEDGPAYRGQSAIDLAERGAPFESVAELLWTRRFPEPPPSWPLPQDVESALWRWHRPAEALWSDETRTRAVISCMPVLWSWLKRGAATSAKADIALVDVRSMLALFTALLVWGRTPVRWPSVLEQPSTAARLCVALLPHDSRLPSNNSLQLLQKALVAAADHELDTPTFVARATASAGGTMDACLAAGLAALWGERHAGSCRRVDAVCGAIGSKSDARDYVRKCLSLGQSVPGYFDPLYPGGDPRGRYLVGASLVWGGIHAPRLRGLALLTAECEEHGFGPTLETGLVAVSRALGLAEGSAPILLSVARTAGMAAHVLEQWATNVPIRPRATSVLLSDGDPGSTEESTAPSSRPAGSVRRSG